MNLQDAVTGTDNPRDLLMAMGVQAFRLQAGYVAKNAPESECSLPIIKFIAFQYFWNAYVEIDQHLEHIGDIVSVTVEGALCYDCSYALEMFYRPHIRVWSRLPLDEPCECCGRITNDFDDIPF